VDWKELFFLDHSAVHRRERNDNAGGWSFQDLILGGLSDEQMRLRPAEAQNSIAWLLWHMTRCEDVAINVALAGQPQVLDDSWTARLGVDRRDIGTGMTPLEVGDLSERVELSALSDYRHAVATRTRAVVRSANDELMNAPVDGDRYRAADILGEHAHWVADLWSAWSGRNFLYLATGHCYQHWGEAMTVRSISGYPVGL
jgi:hypothetical protein